MKKKDGWSLAAKADVLSAASHRYLLCSKRLRPRADRHDDVLLVPTSINLAWGTLLPQQLVAATKCNEQAEGKSNPELITNPTLFGLTVTSIQLNQNAATSAPGHLSDQIAGCIVARQLVRSSYMTRRSAPCIRAEQRARLAPLIFRVIAGAKATGGLFPLRLAMARDRRIMIAMRKPAAPPCVAAVMICQPCAY
jgi:hypothetical protein